MKGIDPFEIIQSRSKINKFTLFVLEAMAAYFFSKVINPHRKCDMYLDYLEHQNSNPISRSVIELLDGASMSKELKGKSLEEMYEIGIRIGHIYGEYLYLGTRDELPLSFGLKDVFEKIHVTQNSFNRIRKYVRKEINYKEHQKRMF